MIFLLLGLDHSPMYGIITSFIALLLALLGLIILLSNSSEKNSPWSKRWENWYIAAVTISTLLFIIINDQLELVAEEVLDTFFMWFLIFVPFLLFVPKVLHFLRNRISRNR